MTTYFGRCGVIKVKDKYDVIVIGAGIGGLACGTLLSKEGLSVLGAEQHSIALSDIG